MVIMITVLIKLMKHRLLIGRKPGIGSAVKDALIRTASNADSLTRLNDGELVIVSAWQDHLFSFAKQGAITDRLKFYVPKFGMPGGGNVVTSSKNAPNPAASLVFVHWITSPEVQQKLNQEFGVRPPIVNLV